MSSKNILLAGGAGYIGGVLAPYLKSKGHRVTVVDLCWFGNFLPQDIQVQKKNIFDLTQEDLKKFDAVIFLGGLSNDPMAEFAPRENFIYNTALPAYLAFIAREARVPRYIYASSCSVYGYTHNSTFTETDRVICNYPYGVSKLQGEESVMAMITEDFSVIGLRQGTVSGYSPRMRLDLVINTMFKNAMSKKEITLSNSNIWRPVVGLHDLADAYLRAVECEESISGIFNIASFNATVGELADVVTEEVTRRYGFDIAITDRKIQDYRNYKVSVEKAQNLLGYQPKETAAAIIDDLAIHLDKFKDFDNPVYYNIEVFKTLNLEAISSKS